MPERHRRIQDIVTLADADEDPTILFPDLSPEQAQAAVETIQRGVRAARGVEKYKSRGRAEARRSAPRRGH